MNLKSLNNGQLFVLAAILKNEIESLNIRREKEWITPAAEIIDDFLQDGIVIEDEGKLYPTGKITGEEIKAMNPFNNPNGYINHQMYSDVQPYEIIKRVTKLKMIIRAMKVNDIPLNKPYFYIGGFSAHCPNQHDLVYLIESDKTRPEISVKWSESKGYWINQGRVFVESSRPIYFYDINF